LRWEEQRKKENMWGNVEWCCSHYHLYKKLMPEDNLTICSHTASLCSEKCERENHREEELHSEFTVFFFSFFLFPGDTVLFLLRELHGYWINHADV